VCNIKNDEQHIICVNYVISGRESTNLVMDQCQLEIIKREIREPVVLEKDVKPLQDVKDDVPAVKVETPVSESKSVRKSPENVKIDEPSASTSGSRGRKRKNNKNESQEIGKKQQPNLPPAATLLSESKEQENSRDRSESSVRDLENAMSKHLPSPSSNHATDFSTNSLLKHPEKESSWNSNASFPEQQPPVMPASTLLKQLYANRESVIRAATRPNYVYSETGAPIPTPPGEGYPPSEGYPSAYSSSYPVNSAVEYNNNNMTPPGSLSPRDLSSLGSKSASAVGTYDYNHYPPSSDATVLQLPLKPQPYSIHNYGEGQYFPHHHPGFWYPTPT
jgi:neuronal PAS domain-containing protein 1/3